MKYWPTKTVADVRDQGLDWTQTLEDLGDGLIITDSSWEKLHGDANISDNGLFTSTTASARIFGGTADKETVFRNTVTLSNGAVLTEDVFQKVRA